MSIRDEYHKKSEEIRNKPVALMNPSHGGCVIIVTSGDRGSQVSKL
jgi:hypothetical protein